MSSDLPSAGRYEIVSKIGAGGMGSVYRAKDPVIGRAVAVKAIAFADVADPKERREMQIRTAREARSAGMLSHPNIVTVHDIGQEGGLAFIVMELVEGPTLWELFCQKGKLGKREFLRILEQSASALDYAHKHGVIHRDVKPSNILVRGDGVAKLTDFGVAKILAAEQLTRTGLVVGTPNYMAPEQIKEQNVTPASDQFGLAVIAYELLTGEKPFDGGTFSSLLYKIMSEPAPPVRDLNPNVPEAAAEALERALDKDPEKRFESCGAFVEALAEGLSEMPEDGLGERRKADPAPPPTESDEEVARLSLDQLRKVGSTGPAFGAPSFDTPAPPAADNSRRNVVIGAAVAVVAALALAAALWVGGGEPATEPDGKENEPKPTVLAENQPAEQPSTQPASPVPAAETPAAATPAPAPTVTQTPPPAATKSSPPPQQPAATAPSVEAPLLVGATTTIVWRGELQPGAELRIDGNTASTGEISRGLPEGPFEVEVSPNVLEVVERPSEANGWSRLRLRNGGDRERRYFLIRCKSP
ncbi:MAG: serine/threonine protein kinase [Acidobacteria bacterium]|nr:serine/threonine protein kinase [Acidobacteriota bacterium]